MKLLSPEDDQLVGRNPQPTRRNLTGTGGSNVTYPAQEARDGDQLRPQRGTDSAPGGAADCTRPAEVQPTTGHATGTQGGQMQPLRNIDSAQSGTVDCTETTEPKSKKKRKMKRKKPTTNQRKKKRREGQQ